MNVSHFQSNEIFVHTDIWNAVIVSEVFSEPCRRVWFTAEAMWGAYRLQIEDGDHHVVMEHHLNYIEKHFRPIRSNGSISKIFPFWASATKVCVSHSLCKQNKNHPDGEKRTLAGLFMASRLSLCNSTHTVYRRTPRRDHTLRPSSHPADSVNS